MSLWICCGIVNGSVCIFLENVDAVTVPDSSKFYTVFISPPYETDRGFIPSASNIWLHGEWVMADIIIIVLGTGGILLMALYAVLCERI